MSSPLLKGLLLVLLALYLAGLGFYFASKVLKAIEEAEKSSKDENPDSRP